MTELNDDLVEVARFEDAELAHEYGLVVLSQGAPYWVRMDEGAFLLLVEAGRADGLMRQLDAYARECEYWPPVAPELPESHEGSYAVMSWLAALVLAYLAQSRWPGLVDWGMVSSEAIREGEYYRALTALFLHGDLGHLAGNLVFGSFFLHLVARFIGSWKAWTGVLLAGFLGNLLNATLYMNASHYSIGASTAVFGGVGLLVSLPVGYALRHGHFQWTRIWLIPIIVGLVFLAWFGTGGERTDTSAHLMGFIAGLPVGLLGGLAMKEKPQRF